MKPNALSFRMAERALLSEDENPSRQGVICFISNYLWLDGRSLTAMRQRYLEEFDRIYRSYFTGTATLPARTRMQAGRTPLDCGLEVEAIGYVPN